MVLDLLSKRQMEVGNSEDILQDSAIIKGVRSHQSKYACSLTDTISSPKRIRIHKNLQHPIPLRGLFTHLPKHNEVHLNHYCPGPSERNQRDRLTQAGRANGETPGNH